MTKVVIEEANPAIMRINERCVDCGQCLKTCEELNGCVDCLNCGQCILTCPMGAIVPKYCYREVLELIKNPKKIVVVSTSPAVRVALGDEFGYKPGTFLEGKLVGALKKLGFDYVFDTTFGADLTVMEEATELIKRIESNKDLPLMTSCCPSWVKYMNDNHPEDIDLLSSAKSPIGMQGTIIKEYFSLKNNIDKSNIISVCLTPCVSKKAEILKDKNNDYVITTSELAMMLRESSIKINRVRERKYDSLLSKGSGAGLIFGASGGVTEAILRSAYFLINHVNAPKHFLNFKELREDLPIREATINLKEFKIKVAIVNGIKNIDSLYPNLKKYDFVEVMTCPNGCVGGGGQPLVPVNKVKDYEMARKETLYIKEKKRKVRESYKNPDVKRIYKECLIKDNNKIKLHNK